MDKSNSFMLRFSFLLSLLCLVLACQQQQPSTPSTSSPPKQSYQKMSGITMGVVQYNLTFDDPKKRIQQVTIDSLLAALNMGSSHYEENSTLSQFNRSTEGISVENSGYAQHFINNVRVAQEIVEKTDGYFDPTVAPLMKYYGFRQKNIEGLPRIDTTEVQQLMQQIGFDKITVEQAPPQVKVQKTNPQTQLDFSAIAKGYAIDEVGRFLEKKGIENYLVEIGGETRAHGKSPRGSQWRIIIQDPKAPRGFRIGVANIDNLSMATSGNYESFRVIDGQKIGHTMNPKTGFPEKNNLLSATVFAKDCIIADSYATAFMAMGLEKAFNLAQKIPDIEAYFVYLDKKEETLSKATPEAEKIVTD